MLITGNLKIYRGVGVSSTFPAVMRCSYQFFCGVAVFRTPPPPNAPLEKLAEGELKTLIEDQTPIEIQTSTIKSTLRDQHFENKIK